jgi:hypothetical protein
MFEQFLDWGSRWEGWLPAQQKVEGAAEAVQVRPAIHAAGVLGLFGSHIVGSSNDCSGSGEITAAATIVEPDCANEAHIEDLHDHWFRGLREVAFPGNDDVGRLDVPVNKSLVMGILQAKSRLPGILACLGDFKWAIVPHQSGKVDSIHELHRQVILPIDLASIVYSNDVRVV